MINADVIEGKNNIFLVRFSEPDESFKDKKYIPVLGMEEVKRRLYFINRKYILDKLNGWLNQRRHATSTYYNQVVLLSNGLDYIKNTSFFNVCEHIRKNKATFQLVAPNQNSRFYNHYLTQIEPILNFCDNAENIENTPTAINKAVFKETEG